MNDELKEISFFSQLLRNIATIFTLSVLAMSVAGMVFAHNDPNIQEESSIFTLAPIGLTYNAILQIMGFSIILAVISAFAFSENFFYKMRFLWRVILFMLITLIVITIFAIIFKWFPIKEPIAWLRFFISAFICFSISVGLTLIKLRLEGKKYSKLLESYKARHNISE